MPGYLGFSLIFSTLCLAKTHHFRAFFLKPRNFLPCEKKNTPNPFPFRGTKKKFPTLLLTLNKKYRWGCIRCSRKILVGGKKNPTFFLVKKKMHIIRVVALFRALGLPDVPKNVFPNKKVIRPPPSQKKKTNMEHVQITPFQKETHQKTSFVSSILVLKRSVCFLILLMIQKSGGAMVFTSRFVNGEIYKTYLLLTGAGFSINNRDRLG